VPRITKKSRALTLIAERGWTRISHTEWAELQTQIEGISANDLQSLDVPVEPPWAGIRQRTFEELRDSLQQFSAIYRTRPELQTFCRKAVISAKDRARAAARNRFVGEQKRAAKLEMVEWMLVWLGDPALFPVWVSIRMRSRLAAS
jgi:hypothetical protein